MNKIQNSKPLSYTGIPASSPGVNPDDQSKQEIQDKKLQNELTQRATLGKSQINFRGKIFNLNKNDLLFLSTIVSGLGLSAEYFDKLKEALSDFLTKNNFKSMSEITSEEHITEQCKLADDLIKASGIDENDDEKVPYLVNRIVERCDSGEKYSPADNIDFIDITLQSAAKEDPFLVENIKSAYKQFKEDDKKLIETLKTTFNLDEKQTERLNEMIQNLLFDFGYFSLNQLNPEENIEDIGILSDNITSEFGLNDHDSLLLSSEILRRIMSIKYTPSINPLDRDKEQSQNDKTIIQLVLNKYNIQPAYYNILYREMKQDAYEAGYSSTLDIFKQGKDIANYKRTDAILNSPEFKDIRTDLLIDFNIAVKNEDAITEETLAKAQRDTERYKKESVLLTLINEQHDLSMDDINNLRSYFSEKKYDYKSDSWKAAYEISEKLNMKTTVIADMIQKINAMDKEEIEMGNFDFIKVLAAKAI